MAGCKVERGLESVNISTSGRGGLGGRNRGGLTRHKSPSITSSEDIEERNSLVAELKRIEQEKEDVSRELKPYMDEMRRKSSWRYMIKEMFFHQEPSEPSVSLELDTILPLLSRQRSIREHKASVEGTNCVAAEQTEEWRSSPQGWRQVKFEYYSKCGEYSSFKSYENPETDTLGT
jgi:hypothetical protein